MERLAHEPDISIAGFLEASFLEVSRLTYSVVCCFSPAVEPILLWETIGPELDM